MLSAVERQYVAATIYRGMHKGLAKRRTTTYQEAKVVTNDEYEALAAQYLRMLAQQDMAARKTRCVLGRRRCRR